MSDKTKEITVTCTWTSRHVIEVPFDYEPTGKLDEEWVHEVDAHTAELVDWEVS